MAILVTYRTIGHRRLLYILQFSLFEIVIIILIDWYINRFSDIRFARMRSSKQLPSWSKYAFRATSDCKSNQYSHVMSGLSVTWRFVICVSTSWAHRQRLFHHEWTIIPLEFTCTLHTHTYILFYSESFAHADDWRSPVKALFSTITNHPSTCTSVSILEKIL